MLCAIMIVHDQILCNNYNVMDWSIGSTRATPCIQLHSVLFEMKMLFKPLLYWSLIIVYFKIAVDEVKYSRAEYAHEADYP